MNRRSAYGLDYDANLTREEAGLPSDTGSVEVTIGEPKEIKQVLISKKPNWVLYAGAGLIGIAAWVAFT